MNKDRRKVIEEARSEIERAMGIIDDAKSMIESAKDEEQDYFDNMPESFQQGDKGQQAEAAVSALGDAYNDLDGFDFDNILSQLDDAAQ